MRSSLLLPLLLLTGCATVDPYGGIRVAGHDRIPAPTFTYPTVLTDPFADEVRLVDSRIIRAALRYDQPENAVFLNGPQKTAVIVVASVVGAYLISEWLEDEVAFFPE